MRTLAAIRDVALLLLVAEALVLGLVPLAASYLAVRGMQRLLPRVRLWLAVGRRWVLQGQQVVERTMSWLVAPVLFLSGLKAGLLAALRALLGQR